MTDTAAAAARTMIVPNLSRSFLHHFQEIISSQQHVLAVLASFAALGDHLACLYAPRAHEQCAHDRS